MTNEEMIAAVADILGYRPVIEKRGQIWAALSPSGALLTTATQEGLLIEKLYRQRVSNRRGPRI